MQNGAQDMEDMNGTRCLSRNKILMSVVERMVCRTTLLFLPPDERQKSMGIGRMDSWL